MLSEKLDVVRLTFYTAPVSLACLAPFFWAYEVRAAASLAATCELACMMRSCVLW